MLFFVKVRIDLSKMGELGQKLASGELDVSSVKWTYCPREDLTVGLNLWEAEDEKDFEAKFAPHRAYYAEVMEITPVVTAQEAQQLLMAQMSQ